MPLPSIIRYKGPKNPIKVKFPQSTQSSSSRPIDGMDKVNPLEYAPITRKVDYNGTTIYLSDIQHLKNYPILIAYVEKNGELIPQLLYYSNSHAVWRVAAGYERKFQKGYSEFSCNLPVPLNMALSQEFNKILQNSSTWANPPNLEKFVNAMIPSSGGLEYSDSYKKQVMLPTDKDTIMAIDNSQFGLMRILKEDYKPHEIKLNDVDDLPNLNKIEYLNITNNFYNHIFKDNNMKVCSCSAHNGKYNYMFAEGTLKDGNEPVRFLLNVSREPAQLNDFLVEPTMIDLGYAHFTPVMREDDDLFRPHNKPKDVEFFHHQTPNSIEAYAVVIDYVTNLPINDMLNHPQKINALRQSANKKIEIKDPDTTLLNVDYDGLLVHIKNEIEKRVWNVKGLLGMRKLSFNKDGVSALPSSVRKQYELINKLLIGKSKLSAHEVFVEVKELGVQGYEDAKKREMKGKKIDDAKDFYVLFNQNDQTIDNYFTQLLPNRNFESGLK